ncbi:MAG: saccharopine dehydrogenase C-terminal domain-containing protein, partial [Dethiobacteria bacterium]
FPTAKDRNFSGARVDITGMRNGKKTRVTYATVDRMKRLTGVPLSIGAYMMGQGKIKRRGVFGPEAEGAINAGDFLQELARRDIRVERWETEP